MPRFEMDDDTAITIAMLHGCTFYQPMRGRNEWYIDKRHSAPYHPVEEAAREKNPEFFQQGWPSRAHVARAYIRHFDLDANPTE